MCRWNTKIVFFTGQFKWGGIIDEAQICLKWLHKWEWRWIMQSLRDESLSTANGYTVNDKTLRVFNVTLPTSVFWKFHHPTFNQCSVLRLIFCAKIRSRRMLSNSETQIGSDAVIEISITFGNSVSLHHRRGWFYFHALHLSNNRLISDWTNFRPLYRCTFYRDKLDGHDKCSFSIY